MNRSNSIGFILALFILSSNAVNSLAQNRERRFSIVDAETRKPIPYANISIASTLEGTFSNQNGKFSIPCAVSDTIHISCIGYSSVNINCVSTSDVIVLFPNITILEEVVVQLAENEHKPTELGYFGAKGDGSYVGPVAAGLFIPNDTPGERHFISSVQFSLSKVKWVYDKPKPKFYRLLVRLRIYEGDPSSDTDHELLPVDLLQEVEPKQKKIEFNIRQNAIQLPPSGVFIVIEFIGYYKGSVFTAFNSSDPDKPIQYQPSFSEKHQLSTSWIRLDYDSNWKKFEFASGLQPNFNFGIEIN